MLLFIDYDDWYFPDLFETGTFGDDLAALSVLSLGDDC